MGRPAVAADADATALLAWFLACQLLAPRTAAAAYIDPISGSVVLQVLAAGALAALFTARRGWQRVRQWVRRLWGRGNTRT